MSSAWLTTARREGTAHEGAGGGGKRTPLHPQAHVSLPFRCLRQALAVSLQIILAFKLGHAFGDNRQQKRTSLTSPPTALGTVESSHHSIILKGLLSKVQPRATHWFGEEFMFNLMSLGACRDRALPLPAPTAFPRNHLGTELPGDPSSLSLPESLCQYFCSYQPWMRGQICGADSGLLLQKYLLHLCWPWGSRGDYDTHGMGGDPVRSQGSGRPCSRFTSQLCYLV